MLVRGQYIRKFTMDSMAGFVGAAQSTNAEPPNLTIRTFHDTQHVVTGFQGMTTNRADGIFTALN